MDTRRGLVAAVAVVTLAGCASAADVASSDRAEQAKQQGQHQTQPTPAKQAKSPAPTTSPPTTSESPSASPSSSAGPRREPRHLPNVAGAFPTFLTPSRNIGCAISRGSVRCDIGQHVYREPKKPAGCHGDYGQSIAVARTGIASFVCVTDTVISRRAPILAYSTSTVVGDFGCTSRQSGIQCYYLPSKHGFWMSQERPVLF